ncbi:MAG: histidine phosphatase family protein [Gemmataceae bacterium]|nr:histidine phosphatase family protein [Gemmataceae bacterium]
MTLVSRLLRCLVLATIFGALGVVFFNSQRYNGDARLANEGAKSTPKQVLILRHAEKSNDDTDIHLRSRGAARAAALPALFVTSPVFPTKQSPFATPDFIFAAKPTKHSQRSLETVTPLAKALDDMPISQKQANDDFPQVVEKLFSQEKYFRKTVLICWHHGNIPPLAHAIVARAKNRDKLRDLVPKNWDSSVFDRVWVIAFDEASNATFANQPQRLMFGDAKK